MSYNTLKVSTTDYICTLTLHRPDAMNAFTVEMANELIDFFTKASNDDDIRAIVVTGSGRAFCAGMDLSAKGNVFGLDESAAPTMADMNERLDDPNNKIGITPEACSTWFLPRIVNMSTALEWCYTGEILKPDTLIPAGFAKGPYAADDLLEEAYKIARKIASYSPPAITLTRQMMYRNSAKDHPIEAHKVDSLAIYYQSLEDGKEGVASFLEKRAPEFKQKSSEMPDFYPWW